eukprot:TRINITY_DN22129_c0_g1_i1.p1 TRINITY_DN22129_c0_g1~~TRINITY_DN22129_c0_g1_i1.p1  ORF type:complete len:160 (-),score=0.74 TRINITY_DN22129_c0_g1_i1:489-968(-)
MTTCRAHCEDPTGRSVRPRGAVAGGYASSVPGGVSSAQSRRMQVSRARPCYRRETTGGERARQEDTSPTRSSEQAAGHGRRDLNPNEQLPPHHHHHRHGYFAPLGTCPPRLPQSPASGHLRRNACAGGVVLRLVQTQASGDSQKDHKRHANRDVGVEAT